MGNQRNRNRVVVQRSPATSRRLERLARRDPVHRYLAHTLKLIVGKPEAHRSAISEAVRSLGAPSPEKGRRLNATPVSLSGLIEIAQRQGLVIEIAGKDQVRLIRADHRSFGQVTSRPLSSGECIAFLEGYDAGYTDRWMDR